ncbi:MAG: DUF4065 domain-containing protein [Bacteroidales bacterium]
MGKIPGNPMGPVPDNFQGIFEHLCRQDEVDIYYTEFEHGPVSNLYLIKTGNLTSWLIYSRGIDVMEKVAKKFQNTSTNQIIEISHQEKAWQENEKSKKLINYQYGFELN